MWDFLARLRGIAAALSLCEYREILWSDVEARFGKLSLKELLDPERLKQVFGD